MKTNKPDRPPEFQKAHGLNVASGRRNDIEYIYIGETPRKTMNGYIAAMQAQIGV